MSQLHLYVKTLMGQREEVVVSCDATVDMLKAQLQTIFRLPPTQQKLLLGDKELSHGLLTASRVCDGSTLTLVPAVASGSPHSHDHQIQLLEAERKHVESQRAALEREKERLDREWQSLRAENRLAIALHTCMCVYSCKAAGMQVLGY
eukprot:comp18271_c1_seq1/m.19286 comp18271_c1_seq1/g.19286  ORF comp18271_c1_seq1/g.19286 comp18271_c1_seq1/m.19286 type:complete len:148 (-) comp18271_c1_seq1:852-1295(-)